MAAEAAKEGGGIVEGWLVDRGDGIAKVIACKERLIGRGVVGGDGWVPFIVASLSGAQAMA